MTVSEVMTIPVSERAMRHAARLASLTHQRVEDVLADTLYFERQRLERAPRDRVAREQRRFYRSLGQRLLKASSTEQVDLLRQTADRFAREVVGHFDPRVYAFTTRVIPVGAGLMVNAVSPLSLAARRAMPAVVNISTKKIQEVYVDPFFRDYFGRNVVRRPVLSHDLKAGSFLSKAQVKQAHHEIQAA